MELNFLKTSLDLEASCLKLEHRTKLSRRHKVNGFVDLATLGEKRVVLGSPDEVFAKDGQCCTEQ